MNQPLSEDVAWLEHYGVKGQKWGVRNEGRRADGRLTRTRQAVINQNDRFVAKQTKKQEKRAAKGKTPTTNAREGRRQDRIDEVQAQSDRIKSGKLWQQDRARIYNTISLYDLATAYDRPDLA